MIDQEQATQNSEAPNSEAETQTSEASETSNTSTTQADDETINLGEGDEQDEDQEQQEETSEEEDTRTDEQKAADEAREKLFGAPEEDKPYEVSGLPEGMEVDTAAVEALTPLARQLNLSNEGFSALAQVYAEKILPGVSQQIVDGLNQDALDKRKEWENEARDAISGKGDKLKTAGGEVIDFGKRSLGEVQKIAAKTLDKFAPAGFRKWLDETGLGVHPQMIALAYNVGKDIAEDRDVEPSETGRRKQPAGGGRPMTDASKFYSHE